MANKPKNEMTAEELRQHECTRKRLYRTREEARRALRLIKQQDPNVKRRKNPLSVYSCPWALYDDGPHYHVGHRPTRKDPVE